MSTGFWGADTSNEIKPIWQWVRDADIANGAANTFASDGGWTYRWPWCDEVIVAIGNLPVKLGAANLDNAYATVNTAALVNTTAQKIGVLVCFNEAVHVTGVPTIDLITTGTGTAANVTLSYNAAASDLSCGKVLFSNLAFDLNHADYANTTLVLNSSSIATGWNTIHDAANGTTVANGIVSTVEDAIEDPGLSEHVYQTQPVLADVHRFGTAVDSTGQVIGFELKFSGETPFTVTGVPTINALPTTAVTANVVLSYNAALSTLTTGNLVFVSTAQDYSDLTENGVYTINATSVVTGFTGIKDANAQTPANTSRITIANTFTVVQGEPFQIATTVGANIETLTNRTLSFLLQFDRAVVVNTSAKPTIRAISDNTTFANASLLYASGTGTDTLTFSNVVDMSTQTTNQTFVVNATSVLTNFGSISNGGVSVPVANQVIATANHVHVITPPVDIKVWANTAPANTGSETLKFGVQFDRVVYTTTAVPTLLAKSNNVNVPDATLVYASGNNSDTLIFSNAAVALANGSNTVSFKINASSTLTNFGTLYDKVGGATITVTETALVSGNTVTVATT
jgi:hypothetical protein